MIITHMDHYIFKLVGIYDYYAIVQSKFKKIDRASFFRENSGVPQIGPKGPKNGHFHFSVSNSVSWKVLRVFLVDLFGYVFFFKKMRVL